MCVRSSGCCGHLRPSLLGDLCGPSFSVLTVGGGRERGVCSLAPLAVWLRVLPPRALAQMQALALEGSGGLADCTQGCVAGALTASAALTGQAWWSGWSLGMWLLSSPFPTAPSLGACGAATPAPAAPDRPLLLGPVTTFCSQILQDLLLCARCHREKEEAVGTPPCVHSGGKGPSGNVLTLCQHRRPSQARPGQRACLRCIPS